MEVVGIGDAGLVEGVEDDAVGFTVVVVFTLVVYGVGP